MADTFKVKATRMVALLAACGVDSVQSWPISKLRAKVDSGVKKYKDADTKLKDPELEKLYGELVEAERNKQEIDIEDDLPKKEGAVKKPAAEKPEPKAEKSNAKKGEGSGKKATAEKEKPARKRESSGERTAPSWADLTKTWEKTPQELTDRGPGVVRYIIEQLKKADDGSDAPKGITKDDLHKKLVAKFDDRDPEKMRTTLNNQIPSRLLLVRHIHVWKGSGKEGKTGYFIRGEGMKAQPASMVPKKAKKEKPVVEKVAGGKPKASTVKKAAAASSKKKAAAAE